MAIQIRSKVVNYVRLSPCNAGPAQLWYWNLNGQIINKDWNGYFGTQGCMYAPATTEDVYVETCNITVADQMFFASN